MKKYGRDYLFLLVFAGIIIGFDQWTKSIVRANLVIGTIWSPWDWLTPYARIIYWYNSGVAFGMFQGQGLLFTILAVIVVAAIIYYYPRVDRQDWPLRLAMVLQLGGAIGNLLDRLFFGYVTDFISVGNFPVFNLADASISVGVAVLLLGIWRQERRERKSKAGGAPAPTDPSDPLKNEEAHCD